MDGDIALIWDTLKASPALNAAGDDLATDAGLETAVIISLFTDRRAGEADELPATETDRRGWWGNTLQAADDEIGSKLWLLRREKQMQSVVRRAEEYAREALQWLIRDRAASAVQVTGTIPRTGILHLHVEITRPAGEKVSYQYHYNWQAQEMKVK